MGRNASLFLSINPVFKTFDMDKNVGFFFSCPLFALIFRVPMVLGNVEGQIVFISQ